LNLPVYMYGVPNRVGMNVVSRVSFDGMYYNMDESGAACMGEDEAYIHPGDSGAPSFGFYGNQLALAGTHSNTTGQATVDTFVPFYLNDLTAAMTGETVRVEWRAGDLNRDCLLNAMDIDLLYANLGGSSQYDLNRDGHVNQADVTYLLTTVLGAKYGDADLDGRVDYWDFQVLLDHWQCQGDWAEGNFFRTGNDLVEFGDFQALLDNWSPLGYATTVPEPTTFAVLALGGMVIGRRRKMRGA
jgi:hypothetical protein